VDIQAVGTAPTTSFQPANSPSKFHPFRFLKPLVSLSQRICLVVKEKISVSYLIQQWRLHRAMSRKDTENLVSDANAHIGNTAKQEHWQASAQTETYGRYKHSEWERMETLRGRHALAGLGSFFLCAAVFVFYRATALYNVALPALAFGLISLVANLHATASLSKRQDKL
jgi:hypothetical protein